MKALHKFFLLMMIIPLFNIAKGQSGTETKMIPFASGLTDPVCITNAGDERLFVINQQGTIQIVNADGTINPEPFLDIKDRVTYGGERGLLGLAFSPDYKTNGFFYVNYVGNNNQTYISRFKVSADNPEKADVGSEVNLLNILQPFNNHNGGDLCFGSDSMLYIGLGDGGSEGDPGNRARNPLEYLGKILRIDVNQGNSYSVPPSNPFYNRTDTLAEIWAMGLRNPWRFSFDRLTGDLWIGDVGQDKFEEIDFQPANSKGGQNYGWRCYEGNEAYNLDSCESKDHFTFPVYTYAHGPECAVIGGYVYRGTTTSSYYGQYFFADYCSDKIWTLHKEGDNWVKEDFGDYPGISLTSFGEDMNGQLYIAGTKTGILYKVISNTTGIATNPVSEEIKVTQIPFSNIIRIETPQRIKEQLHIIMADMKGTVIFSATIQKANYEFDTGELPSGIYLVNIVAEGKRVTHKLIKKN